MKHTKSPWKITDRNTIYSLNRNKHNQFYCTVFTGCCCNKCIMIDKKEMKANARLIAAAPELLEVLKAAREHLEYCGYGDKWERECADKEDLPNKIEQAITKAEGDSK